MNLKDKIEKFKIKSRNFLNSKFKKGYRKTLSIALAGIIASAMVFSSFNSVAGASTVEEINSKYEDVLRISNLNVDDVKDVGYDGNNIYILKNDGSVLKCSSKYISTPDTNSIVELYGPGTVSEFIQIHTESSTSFGFIVKNLDGTYSTMGTNSSGMLDFDTSKSIDRIELSSLTNGATAAVSIYYSDGSVNIRGTINYKITNISENNVKKVYLTPNSNGVYILLNNGDVKAMGKCSNGQFGIDQTSTTELVDVPVSGVVDIFPGGSTVYFILSNDDIVGLGDSAYGQLGNVASKNTGLVTLPFKYSELKDIIVDSDSIYFLHKDGTTKGLGRSDDGQLGNTNKINSIPVNVPLNDVSEVFSYAYTTLFLVGDQLYGLGNSSNGEFGVISNINSEPVHLTGNYSEILSRNSVVTTDGTLIHRYKDSIGAAETYAVDNFKTSFTDSSTFNQYFLGSNSTYRLTSSSADKRSTSYTMTVDYIISNVNRYFFSYATTDNELNIGYKGETAVFDYLNLSKEFDKVYNYYSASKYLELSELSYSQEDLDLAKSFIDKLPTSSYKTSVNTEYTRIQDKVTLLGESMSLVSSLEEVLDESVYNEALIAVESLDGDTFPDEKASLTQRLNAVRLAMDTELEPVTTAVNRFESTKNWRDYKEALVLVNQLPSAYSVSKEAFSLRLSALRDESLSLFEEECDDLVSKAEKSKLASDLDTAYDAVILLPLSNTHRNGFLTRLGIKGIGVIPEKDPVVEEPVVEEPVVEEPVEEPVVEEPIVEEPVEEEPVVDNTSSVNSTKANIVNTMSSVSNYVDSSPNATQLSQMQLSLSVASKQIDSLDDSDTDKATLRAQCDSLSTKLTEVSTYYQSSYANASALVSKAETSRDRNDAIKAYKSANRLPKGIERDKLIDRLDAIELN